MYYKLIYLLNRMCFMEDMAMRNIVAFYPYTTGGTNYIDTMQGFIESKYQVIDYNELKRGTYDISLVKIIYLNWIESKLNDEDKKLLLKAKVLNIKIIWVFHNKIPHETDDYQESIHKIQFLIKISNKIIIHSKKSEVLLKEYRKKLKNNKIYFLPHPDFINDYGDYGNVTNRLNIGSDTFVFAAYGQIRPYKNIELLIQAFEKMDSSLNCILLIAGRPINAQYEEKIKKLTSNKKIVFDFKHISSLEMQTYINVSDLLVLPYDLKSSMNSGVMIMAFSYKKTVIVPNIYMADDFDEQLIYKYSYTNEQEHIKELHKIMEQAYFNGKINNQQKGELLYNIVKEKNNKKKVCTELLNLLEK